MKVETIYQNPPFDKLEIIYEDDGTYNIVCSTKSHGSKVMGGTRVKDIMCIEIKYVPMPWGHLCYEDTKACDLFEEKEK